MAGKADAWYDRVNDQLMVLGFPLLPRTALKLIGDHNVANALCAALAVMLTAPEHRTADSCAMIADGLRSFRALEHRIEVVGEIGGVLWINDSKSTNVTSTLVALRGMGLTRATALTKLLNLTSNIASVLFFAIGGKMFWLLGLCMAAGAMLGGWIGSHTAMRFGARLIRPLLVILSLGLTVRLLWSYFAA